jgi:hypothetical protein
MSTRSKIVYVLLVLVFAFTSLAAGAFAAVETAAFDFNHGDSAVHFEMNPGTPAYSIAVGECDMGSGCGYGSG